MKIFEIIEKLKQYDQNIEIMTEKYDDRVGRYLYSDVHSDDVELMFRPESFNRESDIVVVIRN